MINPAVQRNTEKLNDMVLNHHLAMQYLVPALMNFYTGKYSIFFRLEQSVPCQMLLYL